jgi:hypothetical protein
MRDTLFLLDQNNSMDSVKNFYQEAIEQAIALLVDGIYNSQNSLLIQSSLQALGKIAQDNKEVIANLETFIDFLIIFKF